ncbi:MAG: hypothetical protein MJ231_03190 [bacterium]|nr:hypothetical protein [bacterium]
MKKYSKYLIAGLILVTILISICFIPISVSRFIPMLEKQVSDEIGASVHIDKLILRVGPYLKLKTPQMHITYSSGTKFAQLDNVKFYIPLTSIFNKKPKADLITARKLIVRVNSTDKELNEIINRLSGKEYVDIPNIHLKSYDITYKNVENSDKYVLAGQVFELDKVLNYKNLKVNAKGAFSINNKKYLTFDVDILPKINLQKSPQVPDIQQYIDHMKNLDFYSDIIADIKLYKDTNNTTLASGFINIDNISVLDKNKKTPKSFVYLTLWGNKASVLSNIYVNQAKKVAIEGMINNSNKPVLDLKVKTDEIVIKDLYDKLSFFMDFSKLKNIEYINGVLNANFTLKGDLSKIKSSGYLKISNAEVRANGLQIDKINSDIDFSNNKINIVNAVGYVKNSPIMAKGFIDKNIDVELLMNKVELKYLSPAFLGVKKGIASVVANISGTLDNVVHQENIQINDLELDNDYGILSIDSLKFNTNKASIAYIDNISLSSNYFETIKIPSMKLTIDNDRIVVPETNVFLPNSKLVLNSLVTNYNNKDVGFNVFINGDIYSKDIKLLNNITSKYPIIVSLNGNKDVQNINIQAMIDKPMVMVEPIVVNLSSKLEKNNLKIDDISIYSIVDKFSSDLKQNIKGQKKLILTGNIENVLSPSLKNIRVIIPQNMNIKYGETTAQIKGDLFLNGALNSPESRGQV